MGGNSNQTLQQGLGGAQIAGGIALTVAGAPELGLPLMAGGLKGVASPNANQGPISSLGGTALSGLGAGNALNQMSPTGQVPPSAVGPIASSPTNATPPTAPKPPMSSPMRPMTSASAPAPPQQKPVVQTVPAAPGTMPAGSNPAIQQYLQMLKAQGGVAA
jgi:hypothetical protein